MRKTQVISSISALALMGGFCATSMLAHAEEAKMEENIELEEIVTLGTRSKGRSVKDSPVPVDVISGDDFKNQSSTDINSMLRNIVPSYNVSAQPISDASTFVRPASLRGMAADHTLVLLNGKRRHRSAVINFYTAGESNGAQGPDVSVFPSIALQSIEVLRDGAAAQYGSDAIAGVINFRLKDASEGGSIEAKAGSTYSGDGDNFEIAVNKGFSLGSDGFLNLSASYSESDPTDRSVQTDAAAEAAALGFPGVPEKAQIWGSPRVHRDFKTVMNLGADISDNTRFYAFGNYANKKATSGLYHRPVLSRGGVFTFGSDAAVIDLDGAGGESCPTVAANDLAGLQGLSENCWSLFKVFPGGFTPSLTGEVSDVSFAGGFEGELEGGLTFNISASAGRNEIAFTVDSYNASFGPDSETLMSAGGFVQSEQNINADFSYPVAVDNLVNDLMIAFGFEYRSEKFETKAGHEHSYAVGPYGALGFGGASQGYAGNNAAAVGVAKRSNIAAYLDVEAEVTDSFLLTGALRWEDFDGFGSTTNAKVSARWDLTEFFTLRSSFSTGFRAPTPGQANVRNISSLLNAGEITLSGIVPPTDPLASSVGGVELQPEKSKSFSIGTVIALGEIDVTIDYFDITLDDRISLSPFFDVDSPDFSSLRYYFNDFKTKTKGIDLVATYGVEMGEGTTDFSLAGNWTSNEVLESSNLDPLRIRTIEDGTPAIRGNFTISHMTDKWRVLGRANYFGSYYNGHISFTDIEPGKEVTIDLEVAYNISDNIELIVGASNIFNNFPDEIPDEGLPMTTLLGTDALFDTKGAWGSKYPEFSPMGINGGTYYIRLRYEM
ncbi:MAG: TonB-dependent receptor [Alphaproteobacteria bacterium]|nr:MAG: TonB-dependent receptor [Alphaproteobacteria bacterium]